MTPLSDVFEANLVLQVILTRYLGFLLQSRPVMVRFPRKQ